MRDFEVGNMLHQLAKTHQILLIQMGSSSCAPCAAIRQKLDHWLCAHPMVTGIYVSVDQFPEVAAQVGIFSVPTVLVYIEGKAALCESGYFSLEHLLTQLERYCILLN